MTSPYWTHLVEPALGRDQHRPSDRSTLRAAALELRARGLTAQDIAQALRLSEAAIQALLAEVRP